MPPDACVIFDVDGVLLELTAAEEDVFFEAFSGRCDIMRLSRDWNSYRIRNDEDIIIEILADHGFARAEFHLIKAQYLALLKRKLISNELAIKPVAGAYDLLRKLQPHARTGIATANFREAAEMRLQRANLWNPVSGLAQGADGGGHKQDILGRVLGKLTLPKPRVVYVGDNLNDVQAGLHHGVPFIGFSTDPARLAQLQAAGATTLCNNHLDTYQSICHLLQF